MFQVAFATALSKRFETQPAFIDLSSSARVPRSWSLSCFGIQPVSANALTKGHVALQTLISQKAPAVSRIFGGGVLIERAPFSAPPAITMPPRLISGYWQGPAYFAGYEEEIRQIFKFPSQDREHTRKGRRPVVAVHVRRGDYASDPHARSVHLVCDAGWYERAWTRMRTTVGDCTALVFSDDPEWVRNQIKFDGDIEYVSAKPRPAWQDMSEMSTCDHFIISNSTFSWWAAFLGQRDETQVFAPFEWLRGKPTRSLAICPESWTVVA